jgi:hypothetical protein
VPLAFLAIGAILVIVAIRGTHANLGALLVEDFTGSGSGGRGFLVWLAAIATVGALGFVPGMKVPARLLLALVILGLLISNKGVFAALADAVQQGPQPVTVRGAQAAPTAETLPNAFPVQLGGAQGSSGGNPIGQAGDVIGTAAKVLPFLPF